MPSRRGHSSPLAHSLSPDEVTEALSPLEEHSYDTIARPTSNVEDFDESAPTMMKKMPNLFAGVKLGDEELEQLLGNDDEPPTSIQTPEQQQQSLAALLEPEPAYEERTLALAPASRPEIVVPTRVSADEPEAKTAVIAHQAVLQQRSESGVRVKSLPQTHTLPQPMPVQPMPPAPVARPVVAPVAQPAPAVVAKEEKRPESPRSEPTVKTPRAKKEGDEGAVDPALASLLKAFNESRAAKRSPLAKIMIFAAVLAIGGLAYYELGPHVRAVLEPAPTATNVAK